jgi:uncharacterized membrane protein
MGLEHFGQPNESSKDESSVASELRLLTARVEALERELADMRSTAAIREAKTRPERPAPPPPLEPPLMETQPVTEEIAAPSLSLENRLGAQVFNRVGIIALMIGVTWFLKLAIDNQWIGPVGRVLIGLIAGAGVVLWSEQFRRKGFPVFSFSLKAIGSGVLYLTLWAAQQLYHLLPPSAALGGMILVTAWNAYMAWAQDAELLAAYALAGGLATPLLLSSGGNHEVFLFTYLLAIDAATVALARIKPWYRLLAGAFPATVLYFIFWYATFYQESAFAITSVFVGLFFFLFATVPLETRGNEAASQYLPGRFARFFRSVILPLGDAAFGSLPMYSVMQDSGRHWFLPWLMLIFAAVYLLIARLPQSAVPGAIHLSLAVVFLTIAVPLKASGHWITVGWLMEGVALLWVAVRISSSREISAEAAPPFSEFGKVLLWLAAGSLVLGLSSVFALPFWYDTATRATLFNRNLATAISAAVAFSLALWLAWRAKQTNAGQDVWARFALAAALALDALAVLISLREITSTMSARSSTPFWNTDFAMALLGLATLSAMAWICLRVALTDRASLVWFQLSGGSVIAANLVAILTGVREIRYLWPATLANLDSELQRALAVSAFLMAYGAVLLAAGFWKRSSFIRWQALILLVFSIGKTFLYDMRNLSQGYRVVSFLGLGVLLMTVSFAYQKDWLALKEQNPQRGSEDTGNSR